MAKKWWEWIGDTITVLLALILLYGIFQGSINYLTEQFTQYLIEISFILAGISFYALFTKIEDKYTYWIAQASHTFILAGFAFLSYLIIPHLNPDNWLNNLLIALNPLSGMVGALAFTIGMGTLVFIIHAKANKIKHPDMKDT